MEIPEKFKIAGHEYVIEQPVLVYDGEDTIFGNHDSVRCRIRVAQCITVNGETISLTTTQRMNTFWHEVFHAFNYYWNNEQDEDLAQVFANFMCEYELTKRWAIL